MVGRPAARILDPTIHPLPSTLLPGPGSFNVFIGMKMAWRGVPLAAVAGLQAAKATADAAVTAAETATKAAAGTPGAPAAIVAEVATKATALSGMTAAVNAVAGGGATPSGGIPDIHLCLTPLPAPIHGPGLVIDGSQTVLINGLPACRMLDTVLEALGPTNKILFGMPTVWIGDAGGAGAGGGAGGPGAVAKPTGGPNEAVYNSADEAAKAALNYSNPQSIAANVEYGGNIYQDPVSGKFGFTMTPGTEDSLDLTKAPVPPGTTRVGTYHDHADYSVKDPTTGKAVRTSDPARDDYNSNNFSGPDINNANNRGVPSYLGTPDGKHQKYDPAVGLPAQPF